MHDRGGAVLVGVRDGFLDDAIDVLRRLGRKGCRPRRRCPQADFHPSPLLARWKEHLRDGLHEFVGEPWLATKFGKELAQVVEDLAHGRPDEGELVDHVGPAVLLSNEDFCLDQQAGQRLCHLVVQLARKLIRDPLALCLMDRFGPRRQLKDGSLSPGVGSHQSRPDRHHFLIVTASTSSNKSLFRGRHQKRIADWSVESPYKCGNVRSYKWSSDPGPVSRVLYLCEVKTYVDRTRAHRVGPSTYRNVFDNLCQEDDHAVQGEMR